jgi:hypothetical protein
MTDRISDQELLRTNGTLERHARAVSVLRPPAHEAVTFSGGQLAQQRVEEAERQRQAWLRERVPHRPQPPPVDPSAAGRYRVLHGRLFVPGFVEHHGVGHQPDGRYAGPGDVVELSAEDAHRALAAGVVEPVETTSGGGTS